MYYNNRVAGGEMFSSRVIIGVFKPFPIYTYFYTSYNKIEFEFYLELLQLWNSNGVLSLRR